VLGNARTASCRSDGMALHTWLFAGIDRERLLDMDRRLQPVVRERHDHPECDGHPQAHYAAREPGRERHDRIASHVSVATSGPPVSATQVPMMSSAPSQAQRRTYSGKRTLAYADARP